MFNCRKCGGTEKLLESCDGIVCGPCRMKGANLLGVKLEACDYNRDGSAFYAYFDAVPKGDVNAWKDELKKAIKAGGFPLGVDPDDWQLTLAKDFLSEHRYYLGACA